MTYIEPPALSILKHTLDQRVKAWSELGVYMPESHYKSEEFKQYQELKHLGLRPKRPTPPPKQADGNMLRNLIAECAKSTGRPFVEVAQRTTYIAPGQSWRIMLPNTTKMEPVWAMFLPVAMSSREAMVRACPVVADFHSSGEKRSFDIYDNKIFEVWLDRVKTDPVFKKALGVLP